MSPTATKTIGECDMRYDGWERGVFFAGHREAETWAQRVVGYARAIAAPLPEREAHDMRQLAKKLRQCAADLEAVAGSVGDTTDHITAMAAGE